MSSAIVKNSLTNLKTFLQDYQTSFTSGLLILFTACCEQIFKETTFHCPCKHSDAYPYVCAFVLAPAGVLFLLGFVVSNLTWRLFHGCCGTRSEDQKQKTKRTEDQKQKTERTEDQKVNRATLKKYTNGGTLPFCKVLARSFVVPLVWLFMVSLDGNYYACAMAEEPCNKEKAKPCYETMAGLCNETKGYSDYKADSQFWGWIGLVTLVFIAVIVICLVRCLDPVTYEQNKFIHSYRDAEQQELDTAIQKHTKELAKKNVERFMEEDRSREDWDLISKTPEVKVIKENKSVIFLTHLNELVKEYPERPVQLETNNSAQPAQQGTSTARN